mmetsp:Transcript_32832/g.103827  ORF Transcript_32832/g.103827 Transcript_32832/m.103827 type:complete len:271 (-) Transcript_32832:1015-1827(-)
MADSPTGNLRLSSCQSPSDDVASSRCPNHPSSSTIISTPQFTAILAISRILACETSKYVVSHVLRRTGGTVLCQREGIRLFLYRSWNACVIPSSPLSLYTRTHSGPSKQSPAGMCHLNVLELMPAFILVLPVSDTSASIMKFPEYTREKPHTSPTVSIISSDVLVSAQNGLCWWLLVPRRLSVTNFPWIRGCSWICRSLAQLPHRVIMLVLLMVWKSTVALISLSIRTSPDSPSLSLFLFLLGLLRFGDSYVGFRTITLRLSASTCLKTV